jgi:signal transduction histidine kinase/ligand-binding sensor domain-containing protein
MHRKRVFLKFIFLYFLICLTLWPQTVDPKSDQIPAVMPQCVLQDSYGFIWIGTQEGLLRYDGYKTISYKQTPFDSTSLSHNYVTEIKEDHLGNLWIGTIGGGLNYFDQNTEKFKHYLHDPESENSIGSNSIMKILINDDGSLWLGTLDNGFTHMRFDENARPLYSRYTKSVPPELGYYGIMDMYLDKRGFLWLGTYGLGLERLNIASGEMKSYQHDPYNPASISNNSVHSFCEDDSGIFWMGTGFHIFKNGGGLNKFNPQTEEFTSFRHDPDNPNSLSSDIITGLLIDKNNGLWIGTFGKGLQYIPLKDLYNNRKPRFKNVSSTSIQSIYEDRLGNIWVSPWAFYLTKYDYQQNPFYYLKHVKGNPKSLGGRGAFCIYIDSSHNIWIGHSRSGVTKYNPQSGRYKHYRHKGNDQNSLRENSIRAVAEDSKGNIWFGTETKGIDILDPHTDTFLHIKVDTNDSTALKNNLVRWIIKSHTGDMWIGYNKEGIQLFDHENNSFITYDINPNSIGDESVSVLCEDRSGKLWLGTYYDGLYGVVFENKKIAAVEHFTYSITDTSGLNNNTILDIVKGINNNVLWIATNCGINRFDLNTGKFTHITEDDGLASNFILKLLQDNSGKIWCTTSDGISLYNPLTGKIINYEEEDGLPHTSFGTGTRRTAKGPDGRLYFCGGGVTFFDPEKITDNPNIPPIRLTDFKIAHKSVRLDTAIQFKKNIILNHEQNVFSFEFSALNFTNPAKNQYAYKMEGFHEDWIYIGTERTASFTNLDPGDYTFRVIGSNNHGIWNEKGTSIKVIITPPWWQTWWAYSIYSILFISVIFTGIRYDNRRRQKKLDAIFIREKELHELQLAEHRATVAELQAKTAEAEKEAEKEQMRSRIAGDLHDEIGGNLSSIAMLGQTLEKKLNLTDPEKERLRKIPNIARLTAESMRDIVWFINPANDSLDKLLAKMRETANLMLEGMDVDFIFDIDKSKFKNDLNFRRNLFLLYKEILQNIVRHAKASQVTIKLDYNEKQFTFSVKDNGIGFNAKTEFKGNGLKNFQRRAEEMNGEIVVSSEPDMGTQVKLSVKIP